MASHFAVYRRLDDERPISCYPRLAADDSAALAADGLLVVRLLAGCCPKCGRGITRLCGTFEPMSVGYDA